MSKLEVAVRPVLEALWGTYRPTILSSKQCDALARWTFKTAAVVNYASNYKKIIPRTQVRQFHADGRLPSNATVDIAFCQPDGVNWVLGGNKRFQLGSKDIPKALKQSYVVTLQFERLLLRLAWTPIEPVKALEIHDATCRIHPMKQPAVRLLFRGKFRDRWQLHFSATSFVDDEINPNRLGLRPITKTPAPPYICELLDLVRASSNAEETARVFRKS